jgi:16S rRNA processing protein RimM
MPGGIKGWFKVLPHSASPEALFFFPSAGTCSLPNGVRRLSTGRSCCPSRRPKEHSDSLVAAAHEVAGRSDAERLKGARVFVSRSSFPAAGIDEYYWVDLIGLPVVNREGVALGEVKDLLSTGPQTVLVLEYPKDDGGEPGRAGERMIPFVSAYVDQVDVPGRRILV